MMSVTKLVSCAVGLAAILATPSASAAQDKTPFGDRTLVEFNQRVSEYAALRNEAEKSVPQLAVTSNPAEITRASDTLATKIRNARPKARTGQVFTPAVTAHIVAALRVNTATWAAIMDDNPGRMRSRVNGQYPQDKPLSTVPGHVLAKLPPLPDDLEYRFAGTDLLLRDRRANLIVDYISEALTCQGCPPGIRATIR
jgi:hypothetical protein